MTPDEVGMSIERRILRLEQAGIDVRVHGNHAAMVAYVEHLLRELEISKTFLREDGYKEPLSKGEE